MPLFNGLPQGTYPKDQDQILGIFLKEDYFTDYVEK